jgi:hypothetical protein
MSGSAEVGNQDFFHCNLLPLGVNIKFVLSRAHRQTISLPQIVLSRPRDIVALFNEIAEPVPLELAMGDRASQCDLALAHFNDFPVSPTRPALDVYLLPYTERVRPKHDNLVCYHWTFTPSFSALIATMPEIPSWACLYATLKNALAAAPQTGHFSGGSPSQV